MHNIDDISARVILHPRPKIRCDAENLIMNIVALCSTMAEVKRWRGKKINTNAAIIIAPIIVL